jgi:hypothetical protein
VSELPATDRRLIEKLTRERDQARQELDDALQSVNPHPADPIETRRCFICKRRRDEVEIMLEASRPYFQLLICDKCWNEGADQCSRIIAARRQQSP